MASFNYFTDTFAAATIATMGLNDRLFVDNEAAIGTYDVSVPTVRITEGARLVIEGGVYNALVNGIEDDGSAGGTQVSVGTQGWIDADDVAIKLSSGSNSVENAGRIHAFAFSAIDLGGGGNSVVNTGEITSSGDVGIGLSGNTGQVNFLHNSGTVIGKGEAFFGGVSDETIINTGVLASSRGNFFTAVSLGGGNDVLDSRQGRVIGVVDGGSGDDTLLLGDGDNVLDGGDGGDELSGGAGFDTASYQSAGAGVRADLSNPLTNTGDAAGDTYDSIEGLIGSFSADVLIGNSGANKIDGVGGADQMAGGLADDIYYVDNALDVVTEAAAGGTDRVVTGVSYTLTAGAQVEVFVTSNNSGTDAINLSGNALSNTIMGNDGHNIIDGKAGIDFMYGRAGNDQFYVDNAGDWVSESAGQGSDKVLASVSYALLAGSEIEVLTTTSDTGTAAIDLTGNAFVNTIEGNNGANVLSGAGGSDFLTGNGGADRFYFSTALGASNIDQILDYNVAADTIVLENAIFTGLPAGTLAAAAFRIGAAATDADDRIIYNSGSGFIYFDADGVGGADASAFAKVGTGLGMTNADFLIV